MSPTVDLTNIDVVVTCYGAWKDDDGLLKGGEICKEADKKEYYLRAPRIKGKTAPSRFCYSAQTFGFGNFRLGLESFSAKLKNIRD